MVLLSSNLSFLRASGHSYPYDSGNSMTNFRTCCREEGVRAFWRGNGTNVIRIFPYSAVQFSTNDACKRIMASKVSLLTLCLCDRMSD